MPPGYHKLGDLVKIFWRFGREFFHPTFRTDLLICMNIERHKTTYKAGQAVAAGADAPPGD
jgi:hypothetical protein